MPVPRRPATYLALLAACVTLATVLTAPPTSAEVQATFAVTTAPSSVVLGTSLQLEGTYDTTSPDVVVRATLSAPGLSTSSTCPLSPASATFTCSFASVATPYFGSTATLTVTQTPGAAEPVVRPVRLVLPALRGARCATGGTAGVSTSRALTTVGSYNITGVQPSSTVKGWTWYDRRAGVTDFLARCNADVYGLQEASAAYLAGYTYPDTASQFEEVRDLVNAKIPAGYADRYELVDAGRSNCKNQARYGDKADDCVYAADNASNDNRILYDTATTRLISSGHAGLPGRAVPRAVAWAVLENRFGPVRRYFFATTHLEAGARNAALRAVQVTRALAAVRRANPRHYPTVLVGDFNANRFQLGTTAADYPARSALRLVDIIGNDRSKFYRRRHGHWRLVRRGTCAVTARARNSRAYPYYVPYTAAARKNAYYNTSTATQVANLCAPSWRNVGNSIDYVFASTTIRPQAWETVVNADGRGGYRPTSYRPSRRVNPSDHNLVTAKLAIP